MLELSAECECPFCCEIRQLRLELALTREQTQLWKDVAESLLSREGDE